MKTFKNSARRSSAMVRGAALTSIALLICLSAGCAKPKTTYVNSDHKLTRLQKGQAAPNSGVLMSEGYLAEIFEALNQPAQPAPTSQPAQAKPAAAVIPTPGAPASCPTCPKN